MNTFSNSTILSPAPTVGSEPAIPTAERFKYLEITNDLPIG